MPVSSRPVVVAFATLLAFAACSERNVEWVDGAGVLTSQPSPLAQDPMIPMDSAMQAYDSMALFLQTQDVLREGGARTLVQVHLDSMEESRQKPAVGDGIPPMDHNMAGAHSGSLGSDLMPLDSARCARSLRAASASGKGTVAVWWSRRERGRVALMSAWRDSTADGLGPWMGPVPVDTLDQGPRDAQAAERGAAGCARPAPSVAIDEENGFVHVAYSLSASEGTGIFYAHQMTRHVPFEPTIAIVYGDRVGEARVASQGNVVAIAYEDPNAKARNMIGIAVSRTAGHSFDDRLEATSSSIESRDPYVAVRGRAIVVGWSELPGGNLEPSFRVRRALIR